MGEKLIIVTGFGPFENVKVNPSWEAVKRLPEELEVNEEKFKIEKHLVPVVYEATDKAVEKIWEKNPFLVIHCGVNRSSMRIHLEKLAKNEIDGKDASGKLPLHSRFCLPNNGSCDKIETKLNVEQIVENLNNANEERIFNVSTNVGKFLCGYIYLKSLDKCCNSTLFVHVPNDCDELPVSKISESILDIVKECVKDATQNAINRK